MEVILVLGKRCNLHCKYCENAKMNICDSGRVSNLAVAFMQSVADRILFYGGEPLIYWDDIVQVVEATPNAKQVTFTNGKLLDADKVRYINSHNVQVYLSYDGSASTATRGYDAMAENRANILAIDSLTVYAVITNQNYIKSVLDELEILEKEYYAIHGKYFAIALAPLQPSRGVPDIDIFNYDRIDREMAEIIAGYDKHIAYKIWLDRLHNIYRYKLPDDVPGCGFGYNRLAIDRQGNFFPCQGYDAKVGNILQTSVREAMEATKLYDQYPDRYTGICAKCPAKPLCKNGCLCYKADELSVFCKLRQHIYTPIIKYFKEANK